MCHPSPTIRRRHPYCSGSTRPRRFTYHPNLYSHFTEGWQFSDEPTI
nr:hypothetical protein [Paraglaciecola sp. MB-3u-78]